MANGPIRYGSVCSGIEAATAAWHPLGWKPAWFCEIDAFPCAVLAHHHPEVPNHGDFVQLLDPAHPARLGVPLDILVGGTPCQSFSHAGARAGLDDPRGQLMLRYLDLVGVLRPRWVVWENVPGVLSSGGGRDFGALLGGLADLRYGVSYRVLDARYFGVPQRRRRVFVVGHSGGDPERAARVLALDEGVRGHSAARGRSRKGAAAAVGSGPAVGGERAPVWTLEVRGRAGGCSLEYRADGTANALRSSNGGRAGMGIGAVAVTPCDTSSAANAHAVVSASAPNAVLPFDTTQITSPANYSSPKASAHPPAVAFKASHYTRGKDGAPAEVTPPLSADADKGDQDTLVLQPVSAAVSSGRGWWARSDVAATVRAQDSANKADTLVLREGNIVRRLTPRECERLQGFPDDHTLVPFRGKPATDGHRYKALGNSMAVPVMRWIGERLQQEDNRPGQVKSSS